MGAVTGCVTPHPPIIVEEVGGSSTAEVRSTIEAMRDLARSVASDSPDTMVVMSPHSPYLSDSIPVRSAPSMEGSFAAFRAPQVRFRARTDTELVQAILATAADRDLPVTELKPGDAAAARSMYGDELDHGVLVPLYFLREAIDVPLVNLGLSFLPYDIHYRIGSAVADAAAQIGRRVIFVASGDLSHRLIPGAPAGYDPRGKELDREIVEALRVNDFKRLGCLNPELVEAGGECGLRSIVTLTGCFADVGATCEVMSYEGPFGVGYLVARMNPLE